MRGERRNGLGYRRWSSAGSFMLGLGLCLIITLFFTLPATAAADKISLCFNGTLLNPDVAPYIDNNGRTMVPVRVIMQTVKAQVDWIAGEQKVRIQKGSTVLEMWIGSRTARLNGQTLKMDTAPVLRQNTTMVPVRVIAESFGAQVDWDPSSSTVRIWFPEQVSAKQVRVTEAWVNIRPGPAVTYNPPLKVVPRGTVLSVLGAAAGWYQVQLADNQKGWIRADLVEIVSATPPTNDDPQEETPEKDPQEYVAVVGDNPIAVLAGPSPIYGQVGIAPAGTRLKIEEKQQSWLKVELEEGVVGWVPASLVTLKPLDSEEGNTGGETSLQITGVEVKVLSGEVELKVQATREFTYRTLRLLNPERLVWDIPGASLKLPKDKWEVQVGKNGVERFRLSQYTADTVRIVADLTSSLKFKAEPLPAGKGQVFCLYKPSLQNSKIVLDPGHGTDPQGADPGALGPTGVKEKDVNLAIALKLAELLRAEGAQVYLTRSGENTPYSLNERALYANNLGADLFISIHSNAASNPEVGGTSTYTYAPEDSELGSQREERLRLARSIQEALVARLGRRNIGVLEANFAVLRHTNMPAVLVEVAFISNPEEEKLLNSPEFQYKAALGILEGLKRYFN
ncbi:MAG: N-acetylmuramoyl-L-alanine amidase [Moorellaceae bacterium]